VRVAGDFTSLVLTLSGYRDRRIVSVNILHDA
jgi:hypothetical protein